MPFFPLKGIGPECIPLPSKRKDGSFRFTKVYKMSLEGAMIQYT